MNDAIVIRKKTPAFKEKVGRVNASVFANESETGTWYSLTIDRVYKDGEEFKRTSSFPESEFDNVQIVVQRVKDWIASQRVEEPSNEGGLP